MPQQVNSLFTKYEFSQQEFVSASHFTDDNRKLIQNEICKIAEEKVALQYDPLNPVQFAQREAELQGQIGILRYLLELSTLSPSLDNNL